ncbi:putative acylesterase/phospholipase RssA [Sphingomonas naasensis]|uniref:Patatin-like phospholipase family protein n=1 Tax=Sphingomonas naasensis TaxID=1344951 RepID=A0A4S1WGR0_9SPHN|nr:patatin-like phospholipase family protein [Sphingomonas naasensis]NIJ22032.1 putative acylesterase/phospholipase RssA [Sphingomonas naasensis]TGX42291.1 patatin-like phospholipase family protein [Sphingomonas naasensis]
MALLTLSACAMRGPMAIRDCPGFYAMSHALPRDALTEAIQRDAPPPTEADQTGAIAAADTAATSTEDFDALLREGIDLAELVGLSAEVFPPGPDCDRPAGAGREAPTQPGLLLLSGGGQWGAFGTGFLNRLHKCGELPQFTFISGVSTGALQALFLAGASRPEEAERMFATLTRNYAPASERQIVNRNAQALAALTGSVAGSAPLRRRIEEALCPRADGRPGEGDCTQSPMLKLLAAPGTPPTLLGFVDARNGGFRFVDVRMLARLRGRTAQQCIVGAALASAAVPVFYQQVRIDERSYMDGGVRQSVFEAAIAERAAAIMAVRARTGASIVTPPLYVVRNGPTIVGRDTAIDGRADALSAALRTQSIMVNALEVGSIAALRLGFPSTPIHLATADGWNRPATEGGPGCRKDFHRGRDRKGMMFNPTFMQCLQRFGAAKADRAQPWIALPTVAEIAAARGKGASR